MLTPKDIHEKDFSKSFKGYDMEEVDLFLDQVIEDYDKLIRENRELASRIEALNTQIETYRGMENSLMHTMVSAHKAADDISDKAKMDAEGILEKAQKERESIIREANEQAQQFINDKQSNVLETEARIRELNDILEEFKSGITGYSDELLKLVDTFTAPDSAEEIIEYEPEYEFDSIEKQPEEEYQDDYSTDDFSDTTEFPANAIYTGGGNYSANDGFYPMNDSQYETMNSGEMEKLDINKLFNPEYKDEQTEEQEDMSTFYTIQQDAYNEKPFSPRAQDNDDEPYYGPIDLDDDEVL